MRTALDTSDLNELHLWSSQVFFTASTPHGIPRTMAMSSLEKISRKPTGLRSIHLCTQRHLYCGLRGIDNQLAIVSTPDTIQIHDDVIDIIVGFALMYPTCGSNQIHDIFASWCRGTSEIYTRALKSDVDKKYIYGEKCFGSGAGG